MRTPWLSGRPSSWLLIAALAACAQPAPPPVTSGSDEDDLPPLQVGAQYAQEIEAIAARPDVQRAFAVIDGQVQASIRDLIRLTEIPAPPFMEEQRAAAYAAMLREAGADSVWIDEVGNVLALRRGEDGERTVVIEGHLDTVFPLETDVTVRQRGDTLFAPGIGDDTQGLILVRDVLQAMVATGIRTQANVLFIGTVGEEGLGDLRGVKHVLAEGGPRVDSWIAVDGGDESRVKVQAVGSLRYRITFHGPGGHSWGAFGLSNPHHALGRAIQAFAAEADRYTASGPRTSFNVGRIGGGTSVNSIAFESWMEVDMRSLSEESLRGIDAILRRAVEAAVEEENGVRRRGEPLTVDIALVGDRPAGRVDPSMPLIQRSAAATRVLGIEPAPGSGSTNSNYPMSLGIPATTIGRGGQGGGAHALDEWWLPVNPEAAVKKALLILIAEAGPTG
jgi:tripeptide aminopeptidase